MKLAGLMLVTIADVVWVLYTGANFLVNRINPIPASYLYDFFIPAGIPSIVLILAWVLYFKTRN